MKKAILQTVAVLLAATFLSCPVCSAVSAQKALVVDAQTGRVLYEKNADTVSLIASTTKIMTALLICEQCNVLDRMRIPAEAVGIEGSSMYLQEGEVLTLQELLYGLMLSSGNDAAVALAIYCAGTVEGFVQLMNDKARFLKLKNTHFANPHGLDAAEHYSTARDLATLSIYAMENSIFAKTVSTTAVTVGQRKLINHNKLLWQVEGADGIKTGYTKAAGRILVSSALRQNRRLVVVTIDDPDDWRDHAALYQSGFSQYRVQQLVQAGQEMGQFPVFGGERASVRVVAAEKFDYPLLEGEKVEYRFSTKEFVYAPVVAGADAGWAYVCVDSKTVGKIALRYDESVEQLPLERKSFWQRLLGDKG